MPLLLSILLFLCALVVMPAADAENIIGAATCANSQCHQADKPRAFSLVAQTEFYTWLDSPHAKAQAALDSPRARAIAKRYGVKTGSNSCLNCHAFETHHQVKSSEKTDGITCEACHGSATNWLAKHVSGISSHQLNLANGLHKLEQPSVRAAICATCHQPRGNPRMPHKLYAAGHPVLSFELVDASNKTASHYRVDDDYLVRKGLPKTAEMWRAGQLKAATNQLLSLAETLNNHDAMLPELSLFECASCHTKLDDGQADKPSLPTLSTGQLQIAALSIAANQRALSKRLLTDIDTLATLVKQQPSKAASLARALATTFVGVQDKYANEEVKVRETASCMLSFAETKTVDADWLALSLRAFEAMSRVSDTKQPQSTPLRDRRLASYYAQLNPRASRQQATQISRQLAADIRQQWLLEPCVP